VTLLNRANEYRQYNNLPKIALDTVESVFELLNIYEDGLTDLDKRYMELLVLADRPLGLNAIAASLMINQKTVREVIEPFLLRKRYMIITSSGRTLTTKGYSQYKKWHEKENGGSRNGY